MASRNRASGAREYRTVLDRLAERVVELREAAELTQEAASHEAGVDIRTWQRVEGGEVVQPTLLTIVRMAVALGVEPWELLHPAEK